MFKSAAIDILTALGKDIDNPMGVITVEQLPDAIQALKEAMKAGIAQPTPKPTDQNDEDQNEEKIEEPISFSQRAQPFLELLEISLRDKKPITWGV
jgi:spore cortex formation protein SpoVR/YcgB (stage V sporulation)